MSISSTIRSVNCVRISHGQFLQVRLNSSSRDIFETSASGVPNLTLQESPSTLISDSVFWLHLSKFQDPFVFEFYVVNLLSTLNLDIPTRDLAKVITFYATRFGFSITVDIDHIHNIWIDRIHEFYPDTDTAMVDETLIFGGESGTENDNLGMKGASKSSVERLKKEAFVCLGDELGDCSICYDDLCGGKEVIKMSCTHLFHGSCIIQWLNKNNSCPLCRTHVED